MLIAIEGIDKSGKSLQAAMLSGALQKQHSFVHLISFPRYETPVGRLIQAHLKQQWGAAVNPRVAADNFHEWTCLADPMAFQALMLMDKCLAVQEINLRLNDGYHVILNRYWQSAVAYGAADGLNWGDLFDMHQVLPQADLNILIDTPVDIAMARGRDDRPDEPDRYERDREKLDIVAQNYRELWGDHRPPLGWVRLNGTQSITAIHEQIYQLIVAEESAP